MNKKTKTANGKLQLSTEDVRVLNPREMRSVVGGLPKGGGGGGGCCGADSDLKDPYTGLGSCCDAGSELMRFGSCGGA